LSISTSFLSSPRLLSFEHIHYALQCQVLPSIMAENSVPAFSELPLDPSGPPGNAWGRFGPDDQLGMLNLLTPSVVTRAAEEIKTGIRVSLDWPLTMPKYPSFGRSEARHEIINRNKGQGLRVVNDDILSFNTQSSTQWDGFRHFGIPPHASNCFRRKLTKQAI
jgi:hypothetical protein